MNYQPGYGFQASLIKQIIIYGKEINDERVEWIVYPEYC